jgi:uncharacterized membrane protein YdcZ (DUF606 family)
MDFNGLTYDAGTGLYFDSAGNGYDENGTQWVAGNGSSTPTSTGTSTAPSASWLNSILNTGLGIYSAVSGKKPATATTTAKPTNWLLIGGIAAALLVVILLVAKRD